MAIACKLSLTIIVPISIILESWKCAWFQTWATTVAIIILKDCSLEVMVVAIMVEEKERQEYWGIRRSVALGFFVKLSVMRCASWMLSVDPAWRVDLWEGHQVVYNVSMGQGGWGSKYYNIQDPLQVLTHLVTEDKQPHPKQKKYYKIEEKIK
jgi:hypothetical protein